MDADSHAGLAVTIDVGERDELHPPNKQAIGRRLARAARHLVYGEAITPSGPRPVSAQRVGDEVVVQVADVDGALVAVSGARPIAFELCAADQPSCRFVDARIDEARVALVVPPGMAPTRVRYCWGEGPVCTLYDRSSLPATPFELPVPYSRPLVTPLHPPRGAA